METALRENSSATKEATRFPTTVRIRASPVRCTVSREAHRARSLSFSSCRSGLLWGRVAVGRGAEAPVWAFVGVPGPPATLPGQTGVSYPQPSHRGQSHSRGARGLTGAGRGHSLGTAHKEVNLQQVVQDGDSTGPDEA